MATVDWAELLLQTIKALELTALANTVGMTILDFYRMWIKNGGNAEEMSWVTKIGSSVSAGVSCTSYYVVSLFRLLIWLGVVSVKSVTDFVKWLHQKAKTLCGAVPVVATCSAS